MRYQRDHLLLTRKYNKGAYRLKGSKYVVNFQRNGCARKRRVQINAYYSGNGNAAPDRWNCDESVFSAEKYKL